MKHYTLKACEELIDKYVNVHKGQCTILKEGTLGLGQIILHNAEGTKIVVITEEYLTAWNCTHKVRMYNKMPKRYAKLLDKIL